MNINDSKIAIVHDWFLKKSLGGAEKVTLLLDKFLINNYSTPDIFSLTSNIEILNEIKLIDRKIQTSFIQNLPFGKTSVQNYLPLLPLAIEQLDLNKYDFIISSSHAFAKGVITRPDQLHISYIHTPMRYAWDQMNTYLKQSKLSQFGFEIPIRYTLYQLRQWDFYSSQRVDYLISNSSFTAKRIRKYWGLDSEVIHPPVDVERFDFKRNRENFYLSVNRLVPNKRVDLLVKAFNKLNLPLVIVGTGPELKSLIKIANKNIKFLGAQSDNKVEELMSTCRSFIYAGVEDFGIAPVEAQASGAPVIAFGKGGILDTVTCYSDNKKGKYPTGLLFKSQTVSNIYDMVQWFEDKKIWENFNPKELNYHAQKFNMNNFLSKFENKINLFWDEFKKK